MQRKTLDLWVGAFVVAGLLALFGLAFKASNLGSATARDGYTVIADFDNVGGLKINAPVKSAGVVVGRVADIRLNNATHEAEVALDIDQRYTFPRDTSASILTAGLLGEQYIGLDAGGDTVNLKNGDKLSMTQSAVVLEKLISQFLFNKAQGGSKP